MIQELVAGLVMVGRAECESYNRAVAVRSALGLLPMSEQRLAQAEREGTSICTGA